MTHPKVMKQFFMCLQDLKLILDQHHHTKPAVHLQHAHQACGSKNGSPACTVLVLHLSASPGAFLCSVLNDMLAQLINQLLFCTSSQLVNKLNHKQQLGLLMCQLIHNQSNNFDSIWSDGFVSLLKATQTFGVFLWLAFHPRNCLSP